MEVLKLKNILRSIVVIGSYFFSRAINASEVKKGRIVTFHNIDDIALFEQKILFLKDNYNVISMDEMIRKNPKNSVSISFDDGYEEWAIGVYDVLTRHQVPAVFFVNSGIFDLEDNNQKKQYLKKNLNRDQIVKLLSPDGLKKISLSPFFTIGSHTISHIDFGDNISFDVLVREITEDKKRIEAFIGKEIEYFAFPFGRLKNISRISLKVLCGCGFKSVFTIIPGFVDDIYVLPRDSLNIHDSNIYWSACLSGAYDFKSRREFDDVCELL